MQTDFNQLMSQDLTLIEDHLSKIFKSETQYAQLQQAMDYSLLSGGKRIRPVLALETCRMCGGTREQAMDFAAGVEMIHTYSLIHDDLPAMDDDDLRRGRPTNHKVYGEAMSILAGDALLTAAFAQLARADLPADRVVKAVQCLSEYAGSRGMVGGQALDMEGEGKDLTRDDLELLQRLKTGALISAATELGCIAAGGTEKDREKLHRYAQAIGLAFQIRDDMLDVTSTDEELGKPVGSDSTNDKNTFVSVLGLEACGALVDKLTREAVEALEGFEAPEFHIWLAEELARRNK